MENNDNGAAQPDEETQTNLNKGGGSGLIRMDPNQEQDKTVMETTPNFQN